MPSSLLHLLVDRATISRLEEINTGPGRWTKDYVAQATDVPVRTYAAGAREMALAEQMRTNVSHVGYCEPEVAVERDDRLEITVIDGAGVTGEQYRVTAVLRPSLTHHQKLLLERIVRAEA